MLVKLMNNAKLNARYLHVNKASLFITDKALAEVSVIDELSAYAVDASNVYYYKRPKDIKAVTRDSANVLFLK